MSPQLSVLLTRPEAQSRRFAADWGLSNAVISPVLEIRTLKVTIDLSLYDYLVFTSANAVRALADQTNLDGRTGYAVGDQTALTGAEFGMRLVSAGGDGKALLSRIVRDAPTGRGLYVHGVHRALEIDESLKMSGLETDSVAVYDQIECRLTAAARTVLASTNPVIVPLFSARSSRALGQQTRDAAAPLILIAMSSAVREAWAGPTTIESMVLKSPTSNAMGKEILRRFDRAP